LIGGSFLILGEPGSGKTTALLELARDLIRRAEQDETCSIPVVFNLSSWAESRKSIEEWLIDELNFRYQVPKQNGATWVSEDDLLLLLDGLDEVREEHRDECVNAINQFRNRHMVDLVICGRAPDYEALTSGLMLHGAILQKPLTPKQIDFYFDSLGDGYLAVRQFTQTDDTLQELARSPLVLSIIALAYHGL
jgi:hypothetical protein